MLDISEAHAVVQVLEGTSGLANQTLRTRFLGDHVALHQAIRGYWARTLAGDPGGEVTWPLYDLEGEQHLVLDRTIAVGTAAHTEACALWDAAP